MTKLLRDFNIIISGIMGAGKTQVGNLLAQRLGVLFVDMDQVIEERLGSTVSQIFEVYGESFFREQESLLAAELSRAAPQVIATGGGTLVSEKNRQALAASGVIFNLNCAPEEIVRRLRDKADRPLLQGQDRLTRLQALLEERQPAYSQAHHQIDTTALSVEEVVDRIVSICCAEGYCADVFQVDFPLGSYNIWYGNNLTRRAGEVLRRAGIEGTLAVVTNRNILRLHGRALLESLESAGFEAHAITIPEGEEYKTLRTVRRLYDRFLDLKLDRTAVIVALGGGVIGDIAGFAAATYMRGIPVVQVPTTLLAQIDSSIGGKVAVDLPRGKNLVGAFHAPRLVVTDPGVLSTLPEEQVRMGMAEVIKAGVIRSSHLFEHLERSGTSQLDEAIRQAVKIKVDVVGEDPFERGSRAILNFGHTVGHGLEAASNFGIQHGEAVSLGMVAAVKIATKLSLCGADVEERIVSLLRQVGLPITRQVVSTSAIITAMSADKKRQHGKLRFVLPTRIGEVTITGEVPEEALRAALDEVFLERVMNFRQV